MQNSISFKLIQFTKIYWISVFNIASFSLTISFEQKQLANQCISSPLLLDKNRKINKIFQSMEG